MFGQRFIHNFQQNQNFFALHLDFAAFTHQFFYIPAGLYKDSRRNDSYASFRDHNFNDSPAS